ncbi:MAG: hypothetical protein K5694_02415, partial [Bacilli bacterium]|nr:hypothetical protein [Bacilli bacterium]
MKNSHVLLALAGTIGTSLVATGLASCGSSNEAVDPQCSPDSLHFEVNKDTTLVPGESKGNYIIPRGEGTEDDIKFNVSAGNARTPFILNYTDSLFFVPNMNYY